MKHRHPKDSHFSGWFAIAWLVALLFSACDERTLIHTSQILPEAGWARGDTIELQAQLTDSFLQADLYVEVRHRPHYPYRNLPLAVRLLPPDSLLLAPDSLNLMVADAQANWMGEGYGPLRQVSHRVSTVQVRQQGLYRFQLWHLLPDSLLPEVNDIGIRLMRRRR